jgi:hypothetical protein
MALKWSDKDPNEVLDYQLRWTKRIPDGDAITSSTWVLPDGITKQSDTFTDTTTTIWLTGGEDGETYTLTNRVVTTEGRTMDQSVSLKVKER